MGTVKIEIWMHFHSKKYSNKLLFLMKIHSDLNFLLDDTILLDDMLFSS